MLFAIAFRNLFRQKRRTLFTLLTIIIGFSLLSLSIGFLEGSYDLLIQTFTREKTGHIQIHFEDYLERPSLYKTLKPSDVNLSYPFINKMAFRIKASALAVFENKTLGVSLLGLDYDKEPKKVQGSFQGLVLSESLAKALKLQIGDPLILIAQGWDGSIANEIFPVSGILEGNDSRLDLTVYLPIKSAGEFLSLDGNFHEAVIWTDSYKKAPLYARQIKHPPSLAVEPWQVVEKNFYDAMQTDIKGNWIALFFIMLIASIGTLNTLLMAILERTKEFSIMKALGATPSSLFFLILSEAFLMTLIGCLLGALFALPLNYWFEVRGIVFSKPITFGGMEFSAMTSTLSYKVFLTPAILLFITTLSISLFPAFILAKKPIIKGLR